MAQALALHAWIRAINILYLGHSLPWWPDPEALARVGLSRWPDPEALTVVFLFRWQDPETLARRWPDPAGGYACSPKASVCTVEDTDASTSEETTRDSDRKFFSRLHKTTSHSPAGEACSSSSAERLFAFIHWAPSSSYHS